MDHNTIYALSEREEELMEMLWGLDKPMTRRDFIQADWDRSWMDNYLPVMLKSLEKKRMIQVCGIELQGKNYVRQFVPSLTKEEYVAKVAAAKINRDQAPRVMLEIAKETGHKLDDGQLAKVMAKFVKREKDTDIDEQLIERLEDIIKDIRES